MRGCTRAPISSRLTSTTVDAVMTEADARAPLAIRTGHLRHAQEITDALRPGSPASRTASKSAATTVLAPLDSCSRAQRRSSASCRTSTTPMPLCATAASSSTRSASWCGSTTTLRRLAENAWPDDGYRRGDYGNDEVLIAHWKDAATRLLTDADAPLPSPSSPGTPSGANNVSGPEAALGNSQSNPSQTTGPKGLSRDLRGRYLKADTGSTHGEVRRDGSAARRRGGRRMGGAANSSRRRSSAKPKPKRKATAGKAGDRRPAGADPATHQPTAQPRKKQRGYPLRLSEKGE